MRLFTGIAPSDEVRAALARMVELLRPHAHARWSPPENFHVTTRFIGAWPEEQFAVIDRALASVPPVGAFRMAVSGLHFFPDARRARVLFAGVDAGEALGKLATETGRAVTAAGAPANLTPYTPHLTLARLKNENIGHLPKQRLPEQITPSMSVHKFGSFPVTEFHLYLSEPGPHGSVYSPLRTYPVC